MKIKAKLIISFCIIIFVPIFLSTVTIASFMSVQMRLIEQNYGVKNGSTLNLTNSVQLLNRYTIVDYEELERIAAANPKMLLDLDFLNERNLRLKEKFSYLVLRVGDRLIFNGEENNSKVIAELPDYGSMGTDSQSGTYVDSEQEILEKQLDFVLEDGTEASAFIITSTKSMVPEVRHLVMEMLFAIVLILTLTASVLIFWVYRSIVTPIKKLQVAANNIKDGNLDFSVDMSGEDEIGQLCVSFEEMRLRLKDNADEKLMNEKENRALISNIAHDLKTPITAVKGYAEGIIDGVANTPEKVDKYVRTIYNKANEMDTLINELTLYSKIDANRIPYNFAKINVCDYFQDCVEEIGLDLEAKGIGLSYYNYVDSDVLIIADPEQLRRVVNNIISNSVKYMDKSHGFINIRIKDVGDFIQVELEDNGKGIAQHDLPYIFDRFFRADASRNSATGGSGIGLSIVKKIIEDHGGKIWATSKEGTGTIMYFVIRKYEEVKNDEQNIDC